MRPSTSPAPHQPISPNHAQKFPKSLSVLKLAVQIGLHPLWKVHLWVSESPSSRTSSVLQDLLYVVLGLHVVVQGNMCYVTLGHSRVHGGTCPKRVTSLYVLQRSRSLKLSWSQFSSKYLSCVCAWLGVSLQLHLCHHLLQDTLPDRLPGRQTSSQPLLQTCRQTSSDLKAARFNLNAPLRTSFLI